MLKAVQIQTLAIIAVIGYLLGNFQTAILISKRVKHDDVRKHGSGNPGATNMTRVFGTKWGVVTFIGDAIKCLLAMVIGGYLGKLWGVAVNQPALDFALSSYMGGAFVVLGHCYPVFYRFRGGKGVACTFAFMWMSFPLGGLITSVFAVGMYFLSKKISLVSLTSVTLFLIISLIAMNQRPWLWLFALMCLALIVIRHKDNIKRLINGTEGTINY